MTRKTLVPVDGSPQAEAALQYALKEFPDAEITVLHVVQLPEGYWSLFVESEAEFPGHERAEERARELFDAAEQRAASVDHPIETTIEMGDPAREIVEYAVTNDFDQIVMGSHGRHGVDRLLFGSVAETVVRRAPMTVVVVHETAE
ncbi:UspA domain protein (plasmid) [Haloterrigena turkmenica DSM 5511]|uniref:UspA domain protein n=1 Tax=Haloterrigena turkmenica (strain ATCC 51198 / DSM 5511 / JCM 9101 / NCIMB 13204 / VKM B-1734 / 4k) TaxID=543526 RepID=D2S347_HALTV|nr:universal stress protein [Haloterrigena turkmenica]ADB63794.1 UspA domain protein [Haloterrigena turkmenica DSM 5511]